MQHKGGDLNAKVGVVIQIPIVNCKKLWRILIPKYYSWAIAIQNIVMQEKISFLERNRKMQVTGCSKNDVTTLIGCNKSVEVSTNFSFSDYRIK